MQALDNHTIHALFVPGIVLMDHAGKAVADKVMEDSPHRVVICAGKGNNGGDGWIAARWCHQYGAEAEVVTVVPPEQLNHDAATAAKTAVAAGVPWRVYSPGDELPDADVYVDALLGTGTDRPLQGALQSLAAALNDSGRPIVAVDIPTGVNPNTGEVTGDAVRAYRTVCLAAQKLGTAISPGCHYAGKVEVVDIGIPVADLVEKSGKSHDMARLITHSMVRELLPKRLNESNKGTYGRLAVAVGAMQGAAVLAGMGAARVGAGLIAFMATDRLQVSTPPEFVVQVRPDGWTEPAAARALVMGPGLGANAEVWRQVLERFKGPVVLDADGLQLIGSLDKSRHSTVVTPHPKECARMLGWSTDEVQAHRLEAARQLAVKTGAIVVLKGFHSLVVSPDGRVHVNPTGDSSLATAGTGDVLAGMVGGMMAQSLDPYAAACAAVWLHGRAGEMAGEQLTSASTMASDIVDFISRAIRSIST